MTANLVDAGGHDAPIQNPEEDLLSGVSTARTIHRLISTTPKNWSTRIGLYGSWGSGKTSILNLLKQMEEREKTIVISFSAWAVTSDSGVIAVFYQLLKNRLKEDHFKFSCKHHLKNIIGKVKKFIPFAKLGQAALENASPVPPVVTKIATQAIGEAATFAFDWAKINRKDIEVLLEKLAGRRVVVFIDDLDRADPRVLPKTFLALREFLDWPGFAFVLAFDKNIISKALSEYSKAFGEDVQGFLEKVIDIPVDVPTPSDDQKKCLAERSFRICCDWMPSSTLDSLIKVLPNQPRRIKLLARMMGALRPSLVRHEIEDIDWLGLNLYLILHEASRKLATWVVATAINRDDDWSFFASDDKVREQQEREIRDSMLELISDPLPPADANRVIEVGIQLLQHWLMVPAEAINYWIDLSTHEPSLTVKEFWEFFHLFQESQDEKLISEIVRRGASVAGISEEAAATELIRLSIKLYEKSLDAMAGARSRHEWDLQYKKADRILFLIEYFWHNCKDAAILSVQRKGPIVASLLSIVDRWLSWTANEGEPQLRMRERSLAAEAVFSCDDPELLYLSTDPFGHGGLGMSREAIAELKLWRDEIRQFLAPKIIRGLLKKFTLQDGLVSIAREESKLEPWLIESQFSPLYNAPDLTRQLINVLRQKDVADDDIVCVRVSANAILYLELMLNQARSSSWGGIETLKVIHAAHPEIVPTAWNAAVRCQAPYRMFSSLIKLRNDLISVGIETDLLPLPNWLPNANGDEPIDN